MNKLDVSDILDQTNKLMNDENITRADFFHLEKEIQILAYNCPDTVYMGIVSFMKKILLRKKHLIDVVWSKMDENKYANALNMLMHEKQKELFRLIEQTENREKLKSYMREVYEINNDSVYKSIARGHVESYYLDFDKGEIYEWDESECKRVLKCIYNDINENMLMDLLSARVCPFCHHTNGICDCCTYKIKHGKCKRKNSGYRNLLNSFSAIGIRTHAHKSINNFYKQLIKQIMEKCNITVGELFNEQRK